MNVKCAHMKDRVIVSSLMSGAVALLIQGHATQQKAEVVNLNGGPEGNEATQVVIDKVRMTNYSGHIGSGGPRIVVSNVSGAVVLQRI